MIQVGSKSRKSVHALDNFRYYTINNCTEIVLYFFPIFSSYEIRNQSPSKASSKDSPAGIPTTGVAKSPSDYGFFGRRFSGLRSSSSQAPRQQSKFRSADNLLDDGGKPRNTAGKSRSQDSSKLPEDDDGKSLAKKENSQSNGGSTVLSNSGKTPDRKSLESAKSADGKPNDKRRKSSQGRGPTNLPDDAGKNPEKKSRSRKSSKSQEASCGKSHSKESTDDDDATKYPRTEMGIEMKAVLDMLGCLLEVDGVLNDLMKEVSSSWQNSVDIGRTDYKHRSQLKSAMKNTRQACEEITDEKLSSRLAKGLQLSFIHRKPFESTLG